MIVLARLLVIAAIVMVFRKSSYIIPATLNLLSLEYRVKRPFLLTYTPQDTSVHVWHRVQDLNPGHITSETRATCITWGHRILGLQVISDSKVSCSGFSFESFESPKFTVIDTSERTSGRY